MRYTVDEIKDITTPVAKACGIERMSPFGSCARAEAKDGSDKLYILSAKARCMGKYGMTLADGVSGQPTYVKRNKTVTNGLCV